MTVAVNGVVTRLIAANSAFQLKVGGGLTLTVFVNSKTRILRDDGRATTLARLRVGQTVAVQGTTVDNTRIQAQTVAVVRP